MKKSSILARVAVLEDQSFPGGKGKIESSLQ